MELDHIGIAVENLDQAKKFYEILGWKSMPTEVVESEHVKVGFLNLENNCAIELLESTSPEGPIAKFIDKRGAGIHHVCLRVKNIYKTLDDLKSKNVRLIHSEPKVGAHNCLVAFVHPQSTGGVLLELSQKKESL
ncbi:MAG: methylmalonyl-CoA epimerase [Bdellovibrionaceae bacterium]|nr:methylmalonyl-CoA epimerase [Pseudobdellovibrionaceae bacterium]